VASEYKAMMKEASEGTGPISQLKDSGARQDFGTGSVRDLGTGKGSYDLLQEYGIHAVAMQLERGKDKYGWRNWEKGQPLARYIESARRHLGYHMMGLRDEPHMAAAIWNLMCYVDTDARIKTGRLPQELDDMPQPLTEEETERVLAFLKTL
jgi:hypothetical protein